MRIIDATALPGFARKTAESASDFTSVVHNRIGMNSDDAGYRRTIVDDADIACPFCWQ